MKRLLTLLAMGLHATLPTGAQAAEPVTFEAIHDRVLLAGSIWCPPGFRATAENPNRRCGASIVTGAEVSRNPEGRLMAASAAALYVSGSIDQDEAAFLVAHDLAHHVLGHQSLRMQTGNQQVSELLGLSPMSRSLVDLGSSTNLPSPRADTPKEPEAQERDADLLAATLLSLAGFRVAAIAPVLKSSNPAVIKQAHLAEAQDVREARLTKAGASTRALCRLLARKRTAFPTGDRFSPGYGAAPAEVEAFKSMQQSIEHARVCAGVEG